MGGGPPAVEAPCRALQMVAVLQFSGYAVPEAAEAARRLLVQALEQGALLEDHPR